MTCPHGRRRQIFERDAGEGNRLSCSNREGTLGPGAVARGPVAGPDDSSA